MKNLKNVPVYTNSFLRAIVSLLALYLSLINMINLKKSGYISFKSTDSTHTYKMCGITFIRLDLFYSKSRIDSKFVR